MAHKHNHTANRILERLGFSLSLACSIHCMAMPFVMMVLPFAGEALAANPLVEWTLLGSSLILGSFTLYHDFKKHHGKILSIMLLLLGFVMLVVDHTILHEHHSFFISAAAGLLIAGAYASNWYFSRHSHRSCHV